VRSCTKGAPKDGIDSSQVGDWLLFSCENGEREYEEYMRELGKLGRACDKDLDNQNIQKPCVDTPRDAGFVRIEDCGYARKMTIEKDGLVYASDKSYDLVSASITSSPTLDS